ncbi:MAG TPA: hypothetical protein H9987_11115 [Candidatus Luteococcus avicola]|nr:hypothetical protein [Candidatus Luteococcus avicola]
MERVTFTNAGVVHTLDRTTVQQSLSGRRPTSSTQYWVEVDGVRWAVKEAFGIALGISPSRFNSVTARTYLGRLGFELGKGSMGLETSARRKHAHTTPRSQAAAPRPVDGPPADVVLIGCVKSKRDHGAPARDLYTSDYFAKMRRHAEASGKPWFILSALHGAVSPDEGLEPYDCYLATMPTSYRREWGAKVAEQLQGTLGSLERMVFQTHAGSAYVSAVAPELEARGAVVVDPLHGLTMGQRLAWYLHRPGSAAPEPVVRGEAVAHLSDPDQAMTVSEFLSLGRAAMSRPGMYSWWADERGAHDLADGLGLPLAPGLVYVGQAGATRSGGSESSNTLWGRVVTMHLGGKARFSTLRLSLGSTLAAASGTTKIDEDALTRWMGEHLHVAVLAMDDRNLIDDIETSVLKALDPPLNLRKCPTTPIRSRLTQLRRLSSGGPENDSQ